MKQHTLRFRAKDKNNFERVRNGEKSVETRAATPRYRNIKEGDIIVFVCGKERFKKEVSEVEIFKTLSGLFKSIDYKEIMPTVNTEKEGRERINGYPNYKEKIKKFGILAIRFK